MFDNEIEERGFDKNAYQAPEGFQTRGRKRGQKTEFSLASMFDNEIEERGFDNNQAPERFQTKKSKKSKDKTPFKYDSSEDEEKVIPTVQPPTVGKMSTDAFFLKEDDHRLQDADDFINNNRDRTNFAEIRRKFKEIVRRKIRHNIKINRLFKRKLGGKKRRRF